MNRLGTYSTCLLAGLLIICLSCEPRGPGTVEDVLQGTMNIEVNPHKRVPLGSLVRFRTEEPCEVSIEIKGEHPVTKTFPGSNTRHAIPVLGLYPDTTNVVALTLKNENGRLYKGDIEVKTGPIPDFFPSIDVMQIDRERMEPGFHLIEMLIANNGRFHPYTIMFDDSGVIRWFMDMSEAGQIAYTPLRLRSGNWLYLSWINLWEVTGLGELISHKQMFNYAGDHDLIELENGNILMGGAIKDATVVRGDGQRVATRYDAVVEWDRTNHRGVKHWDLGEVLDIDRQVYPEDFSLDFKADWFHLNSIERSLSDNSVLVSGRNQGVAKIDQDNNLQWILAPHRSWGKAGRTGQGFETKDFLLTAVDADGSPLPASVQQGTASHPDFAWPQGQHALTLLDNGNLLLFDNGLARNFQKAPTYSRAVEYKIDDEAKTIQQVWQYGKERGLEMFSAVTSDVDVLPRTGNRLITAGNIRLGEDPPHAKIIEITHPENKEVFEARVLFKDAKGTGEMSWAQFDLVYRGERYSMYP